MGEKLLWNCCFRYVILVRSKIGSKIERKLLLCLYIKKKEIEMTPTVIRNKLTQCAKQGVENYFR